MPDTTTAAPDQDAIVNQLLQQALAPTQPPAATGARARTADPTSVVGLLGSALGGGPSGGVPLSADEAEAGGRRALLSFGLNMLQNSGYSTDRKTIGQLIGGGIGAAQQSLGQSEYMKAARGQAQQEYELSQREQQLARIKEAVPLLTLQQQIATRKALQGMPSPFSGGGGSASIGTAGDVPFALNNPLNIRFAGQPGATNTNGFAAWKTPEEGQAATDALFGKYAEGGINTLTGFISRWAPPSENDTAGYIKNVAAATGLDPTAKIDFRDPNVRAKVQAAMAVQEGNKNSRRPTAPAAPAATATTAPAQAPAPARAAPGAPQPDVASTGQQFAGPGVPPNVGAATPPSPAATGNANAIMAGMVGAGADPTTLAPPQQVATNAPTVPSQTGGLVVPPGVTPPPGVATTPAGPPPVTPDTVPPTFEEFQKQHPIVVPPEMQTLFNAKPDAEQLSVLQRQAKLAETAYNVAKATGNTAGMEKALSDYNTIMGQENTVRENAAKLGRDAQTAWIKDRITQQHDEWAKMREVAEARETSRLEAIRTQADKMREEALKHDNALKLNAAQGDETRRTAAAATENSYVLKQREQFAADHDATRGALGDYQTLRMFSDAAGKSTPIDNLQFGDKSGRDILSQWGFGTQAQREQWGAQQAFNAVINKSILAARQGVSMGQLSDRDMNFLQHMTVSQMQDPQTRSDIISYLEQTAYKKKAYMDRVEQLWDGGKGLTWGNARSAAEKEFEAPERDVVPRVPPDWKALPPQLQQQFLEQNHINHGSLVRLPNGKLGRYEVQQQ